ncbi:TPM domain-containing protein [Hyalangium gracile]|uniref:TPM domain-containing protein n=1 Tax=Hyalangium gracile TaxID=394092 RepID=UPI001CCACE3A|nr:TPM domain-containing protein [Hyalangium gracile]
MRGLRPWAALAVLLSCLGALAAGFQPPPAPTRWVTDTAGFLSESTRRSLDARLQKYERDTGRQVIVWIGQDTEGVPLEEWAARTFEAWGIGKRGRDDGLAVFVFAGERRIRIEVGYGLEPVVPDAVASRIISEEALPRFREGEADTGVIAAVDALLGTLGGETSPPPPVSRVRGGSEQAPSTGEKILYMLLGIALLIFVITHPRLAFYLLLQILSSGGGRRGGRWGGSAGGSFRGGGGRSGGGGASGAW